MRFTIKIIVQSFCITTVQATPLSTYIELRCIVKSHPSILSRRLFRLDRFLWQLAKSFKNFSYYHLGGFSSCDRQEQYAYYLSQLIYYYIYRRNVCGRRRTIRDLLLTKDYS